MKKILVIGASGFVGPYLCKNLIDNGYDVFGSKLESQKQNFNGQCVDLNILNEDEIIKTIDEIKPDYIIHLAAQSSVKLSWDNPSLTFNINVIGIINIFEALRKLNLRPRILIVGSSEEYGKVNKNLIDENIETDPLNFYALSKVTQEKIALIYHKNYGFDVICARSFNHIGPGQSTQFVVSNFAKQIVDIEKTNKDGNIYVGNLSAKRDFSDVRDIVNAYRLLIEKGQSGQLYNVGSGNSIEISEILSKLISLSKAKINVVIDKNRFRPIDTPEIKANINKLKNDTRFKAEHNIDETLLEVLNYFRNKNDEE